MIKPNRTVQLLGTGNGWFACCWRLIRPRCSQAITPQVPDNWLRNPPGRRFRPFPTYQAASPELLKTRHVARSATIPTGQ